jgi:nicotinamide mononucleotide transporter
VSDWIIKNYIEITGAILGLIYVLFSIRQNISLWFVGILTSAFYIFVFFHSKLYANMSLQFYYLIMSVYGWYIWRKNDKNNLNSDDAFHVRSISKKLFLWSLFIGSVLLIILYKILDQYTDSPFPVWDSFTTMFSIIATWMLARKFVENWLLWIVTDTVSICLYFYMKLFPTSVLFLIYTVMAVFGYIEWKKTMISKNEIT